MARPTSLGKDVTDTRFKKWRCDICGHAPSEEEILIAHIFSESYDEWLKFRNGMCSGCSYAGHLKRHPGQTCCEARLGDDEGCYDAKESCCDPECYRCNRCPECGKHVSLCRCPPSH